MKAPSTLYRGPIGHTLILKLVRRMDRKFTLSGSDLFRISTLLTLLILATAAGALGQASNKGPKQPTLPVDFQMQDLYPGTSLEQLEEDAPLKYAHIREFFTIWNGLTSFQKTHLDKQELYGLYIRRPDLFTASISA